VHKVNLKLVLSWNTGYFALFYGFTINLRSKWTGVLSRFKQLSN